MKQVLFSVAEVSEMIKAGKKLILAGTQECLSQLPAGDWIGGTTPYFMAENGGCAVEDKIFVNEIPSYAVNTKRVQYSVETIHNIYKDGYEHGYSIVILPCRTPVMGMCALMAPTYEQFAMKPLAGWVAAVNVEKIATVPTAVFNGSGEPIFQDGVVFHVELPANKMAEVCAINLFEPGDGDVIEVEEDGYTFHEMLVNGQKRNIAEYLIEKGFDGTLPFVADYSGTSINVSLMIDAANKKIDTTAPMFKGIKYRLAKPVGDYVKEFDAIVPRETKSDQVFSCNCMLNMLFGKLLGRKTGIIQGPFTAGEICYQLVNQTMVNVEVFDI